ncbi:zinc ion binding [Venturia nashicola]|nr:zinc ion binding [Venturia nashicola]
MPAKCCEMIPIHVGAKYLSKEEATEYRTKFEEWKTDAKDRVYCPKLTCSEFIPLKQLRAAGKIPNEADMKEKRDSKDPIAPSLAGVASIPSIDCPNCSTTICIKCKSFAHPMEPCKDDTEGDEMLALLAKWGYKRCPRCGHGTRRMFGCSHMQCICGAHWCWGCERSFTACDTQGGCDDDDDEDYNIDYESEEEEVDLGNTVFPNTEDQIEPAPAEDTPNPAAIGPITEQEARRQLRAENLDARGGRYWETQDMDFGSEPGEAVHGVWGCEHDWTVGADSEAPQHEDDVQCHDCWESIIEKAQVRSCKHCGLLACSKCAESAK